MAITKKATAMIKLHHLNRSRSHRIFWLLEEIGAEYEIICYDRDTQTNLAPPELLAVHPLGKSPMIEMDGRLITESGAITEVIMNLLSILKPKTSSLIDRLDGSKL